ncbi:MAG: PilN domain-containing protein [Nitrospirae bacterium]|nr:PilN domain-containing protein [Nitrospirota bacterium]
MKETLNLLPIEVKTGEPKIKGLFYYIFPGLAVYIITIIVLWFFKGIEIRKVDIELDKLNKHKTDLQQKLLVASAPVQTISSVDREILDAIGKTPRWSFIISEISILVPENVWLSSIESKDERGIKLMSVKGFTTTQLGVANLISALEASQYFYDVEIVFSQKGEKEISFELKTKLKWT